MDAFRQLWRAAPGARPYFVAVAQGALGHGAGYVVLMVVAYERLGSAWEASLMLLAAMLPSMVLGPLVGAWLDRRDRLRSAIGGGGLRAGALAGMIVLPGPGPLLALALLMGLAGTVFRSASFSVLGHAVPEDRRMPATALYGALQDLGMTLGPALAAGMLVIGGPQLLLAVNAGLFAASALLLSRVRIVRAE